MMKQTITWLRDPVTELLGDGEGNTDRSLTCQCHGTSLTCSPLRCGEVKVGDCGMHKPPRER